MLRKNDLALCGPFLAQGHHQKWSLWLNLVKVQEPFSIFSLLLYYFLSFTVLVSLIVLTLTHTHTHTETHTLTHTHTHTHTYTHTHTH